MTDVPKDLPQAYARIYRVKWKHRRRAKQRQADHRIADHEDDSTAG